MKILMTMFGWNDVGGGTSYPRQVAVDLVRQGHEVLVFYAAVLEQFSARPPAQHRLIRHREDGVELVAVQDRPDLFLGIRSPEREICDAAIVASFQDIFTEFQPDVVHYHNFLGLSMGLVDIPYRAGVPALFSAHNFWMICPTLYLWLPEGKLCHGINATGSNCQVCCQSTPDPWYPDLPSAEAYRARMLALRAAFQDKVNYGLVNAERVRELFLENGYDPQQIRVQKLSNPRAQRLWEAVGSERGSELSKPLKIGYMGQVIPIKGVHTLVAAAQVLQGEFELHVYGSGDSQYMQYLRSLDQRGCLKLHGAFSADDQTDFLPQLDLGVVTSIWFEHSALVITEFLGARVPVVGADIGGIPDYLQAEVCRRFRPGDAQDLARVLQALLDQPEKLQAMKAQIQAPEDPQAYLKGIQDLYGQILTQSRDPEHPLYAQRVWHFLAQRQTSGKYAALDLHSRSEAAAWGLDLHRREDLKGLNLSAEDKVVWRVSPDVGLATAEGLTFLPLLRPSPLAQGVANSSLTLPESDLPRCLIPMTAEASWQRALETCLQLKLAVMPVFLPWGLDFELAQTHLLAYLERQTESSEADLPEMALLESEFGSRLDALFGATELLYLPPEHELSLRYLALEAPLCLYAGDARQLEGLFELAGDTQWQAWAESQAARLYRPCYANAHDYNQAVRKQALAFFTACSPSG